LCLENGKETDLKEYLRDGNTEFQIKKGHKRNLIQNCPGKLFMKLRILFMQRREIMELSEVLMEP